MHDKRICIQCVMARKMKTTSNVAWDKGACSKCKKRGMAVTYGRHL